MRRHVLAFLTLAGGLYVAAVAGLFLWQDQMLFPRGATPAPARTLPANAEPLTLTTADGVTLHGVFLPADEEPDAPLILGFPGNAWNAQDFADFLQEHLPATAVVAFHYRGYPPSAGSPSEQALVADALAITDEVRRRWPGRPIVPVGVSLGSAVAAAVVKERDVTGAVLVTPFDSVRAIARRRYWWAPVRLLLRHPFDSADRLDDAGEPIAVISAGRDELIPARRTEALVRRIPNVVARHVLEEHDHASLYDDPRFGDVLRRSLKAVLKAGGADASVLATRRQRRHAAPPAARSPASDGERNLR